MASSNDKTVFSLVMIPAIITLVVTLIRLSGELFGWNEFLFSTEVGRVDVEGNTHPPGQFGIVWLVPVFGFYFAKRLSGQTGGPKFGKAIGLSLAGLLVAGGLIFGLVKAGYVTFPSAENPADPTGLLYALAAVVVGAGIGFLAWPRLAWTLLVYGVLARIPVVVVTSIAVAMDWETHHTKLPPGVPQKDGLELWLALATPQMTVWIAFTILAGGVVGAFARLSKKGS